MPHPRFSKLPPDRQACIYEAAAREFAALGYADASVNRVLQDSGLSKGAAYYYFNDKEDLFLSVLQHYMQDLLLERLQPETLTAETFWPAVGNLYERVLMSSYEKPLVVGMMRAGTELWREVRHVPPNEGPLAAFVQEQVRQMNAIVKRGQAVGVVRTDVPDDLLLAWLQAVDDAHDRWILEHWPELDRAALLAAGERVVDGLRRLLAPAPNPA